ncbi:hypothetical protein ACTFIY_006754 [Dictyostelium cf. discoideum]
MIINQLRNNVKRINSLSLSTFNKGSNNMKCLTSKSFFNDNNNTQKTIYNNINNNNNNNRFYCTSNNNNNNNDSKPKDLIDDFFKKSEDEGETKKNNSIFIQTETTPNPDSLKFIPGVQVLEEGQIIDFSDFKTSQQSPLANNLFKLDGVNRVFFSSDFISVNKYPEHEWSILKPQIYGTIIDFYHSGLPILSDPSLGNINADTMILPEDDEVVAMIKELIETRIRPTVLEDGGNIKYMGFKDGIVMVQLQGTCSSCSSSQATLKGGIERMLMHWISEVTGVIAVPDDELNQLNLDYFNSVDGNIENGKSNEKKE